MQKSCPQCQQSFEITDDDLKFYEKVSPVFNGKKYLIPVPTLCPDCRKQRKIAFRNERNLYPRTCSFCNKNIISTFSPEKPYKVYCNYCWWSDKWDGLSFGVDYNLNDTFLLNFQKLFLNSPAPALIIKNNTNSDYVSQAGDNINCYLIFNSNMNENSLFSRGIIKCKNCIDMYSSSECENCYECINCRNTYNLFYSQNCSQCSDSYFLYSCFACKNCIGCTNLNHKEYYVCNKQCTKEDYEHQLKELKTNINNFESFKEKFSELKSQSIHRATQNFNCENCSGDYLMSSKDCQYCFEVNYSEDCKYCDSSKFNKDSYDIFGYGLKSELLYDTMAVGDGSNCQFCFSLRFCNNLLYSANCDYCNDCFGCAALRHKQYCIFNKQYTKEEYEVLVPKIIGSMQKTYEWGIFPDPLLSPFGYNESFANEYYPLNESETKIKGFNWSSYNIDKSFVGNEYEPSTDINYYFDEAHAKELLSGILKCEVTKRPYKIVPQELAFYLRYNIPIPRKHSDQRHRERLNLINPRKLWDRTCMKCGCPIKTSYSPERKEIVYCEECYQKEVY